jgi:hypothetical protein
LTYIIKKKILDHKEEDTGMAIELEDIKVDELEEFLRNNKDVYLIISNKDQFFEINKYLLSNCTV